MLEISEEMQSKLYRKWRWSCFLSATIGYSLYYVCRTTLNVVKKPILENGTLDAVQLGIIGSALLFSYALGKFVNGFLADHSNIKRFMATGLAVSAVANFCVGACGLLQGNVAFYSNMLLFVVFAAMWGINGWAQSMGAPPAIIALSRWFPLKQRGTYYGFFSASHNLGEFLSFIFVGAVVGFFGWQWGFVGASLAGAAGVVVIILFLHDTPQCKGLPPVEVISNEELREKKHPQRNLLQSYKKLSLEILSYGYWHFPVLLCISAGMVLMVGGIVFARSERILIISCNADYFYKCFTRHCRYCFFRLVIR